MRDEYSTIILIFFKKKDRENETQNDAKSLVWSAGSTGFTTCD